MDIEINFNGKTISYPYGRLLHIRERIFPIKADLMERRLVFKVFDIMFEEVDRLNYLSTANKHFMLLKMDASDLRECQIR